MHISLLSGLATASLLMNGVAAAASHGVVAPQASEASAGLMPTFGAMTRDVHDDRTDDYREPAYGPFIRLDDSAYDFGDNSGAGAPYGDADYHDSHYETRDRGDYYNVPSGYEGYARCLKRNGVTGAAIGALLGGLAGNGMAGRGNRTGGTLVGAAIGGLLGVAVEKANDKCRPYRPREAAPQDHSYMQPWPKTQPIDRAAWQGGYYYYPQSAPTVTVITMAPVITTTTTVTEEVYYETVRSAPRKKAVRKWKPKPICVCP